MGSLGGPWGVLGGSLGDPGGPWGVSGGSLGSPWEILRGPWEIRGVPGGSLRDPCGARAGNPGNPRTPGPRDPPPPSTLARQSQWLRCAIATNSNSITKRLRFRIASLSNRFAFESVRFAFHFASLPNFESSLSNRFAFGSLRFRIARNESYWEPHTPNGSADIYYGG